MGRAATFFLVFHANQRAPGSGKAAIIEESVGNGSQLSAEAFDLDPQACQVPGKSLDVSRQFAHVDRPNAAAGSVVIASFVPGERGIGFAHA